VLLTDRFPDPPGKTEITGCASVRAPSNLFAGRVARGAQGCVEGCRGPRSDARRGRTHSTGLRRRRRHVNRLLLAAGGWRRWAASGGLAAQTPAPALTASAAIVLLAAGLRGGLAEYLPGGINDDNFADESLYVLFMIHDTAPWFAWWGVVVAAGLLAWLSFTRRVVPLWLGIFSAVAVLAPVLIMALTGAVAGAGLIGPIWLAAASVAVACQRLSARQKPQASADAADARISRITTT